MSEAPTNALLTPTELEQAARELPDWTVGTKLRRKFSFPNFPAALAFMVSAGFEAERLNHHPNWSNVYNQVDVELWSHDLGGPSQLCLALAKSMDRLA